MQPAVAREEFRDELRVSRLRLMQGWLAAVEGDTGASLAILRPLVAAAELGVSPNTVNTHLRSAFAKLGVRSRVQLSNVLRDQAPCQP
ncbi:MAG: hypothetical protein QOH87_2461 [Trebonia sp.]|jgi:hypothetical protein|nr:hypothetical protein [Trebonia sp.]